MTSLAEVKYIGEAALHYACVPPVNHALESSTYYHQEGYLAE